MAISLIPLSAFYGITVSGLTANPLSGFTLATPFTCALSAQPGITEAAITSNYNIIWWFGDGTYSTEYAPIHTYNWPGVYEIKIGLYNNNPGDLSTGASPTSSLDVNVDNANWILTTRAGVNPFTFSTTVTASNFIVDKLYWSTSGWLSSGTPTSIPSTDIYTFYGYQSNYSGNSAGPVPLTINYFTSLQDNNNINFTFYADNSLSQPWTEVPDGQLINLRPRWRFTSASATSLDNEVVLLNYQPISSTPVLIDNNGRPSSSGTQVGLSGSFNFYYVDDLPSMVVNSVSSSYVNPTTLWVNLDTLNIPNPPARDYDYIDTPAYANTAVSLSAYYYVQSLIPDHIDFTLNGKVPFESTYWSGVSSRFVMTINSPVLTGTNSYLSDTPLLNYPLNILSGAPLFTITFSPSGQGNVQIYFETPVSGVINTYNTSYDLQTFAYTLNSVAFNSGFYIAAFTPYVTAGTAESYLYSTAISGLYYVNDLTANPVSGFYPYTLTNTITSVKYSQHFSGYSPQFDIVDFNSTYFARKFGAGFDFGAQLKSYALQPTIAQNTVFFNDYLSAIAGTSATNEDTFGGVLYEKITNFVENTSDPLTSNVNQFYSLSEMLDLNLNDFNYTNIPPGLGKIYDLYSVQQSRVWGARSQDARNFTLSAGFPNLGGILTEYNISTTMVSAGQKIVVNDMFNSQYYELLEVPAITSYASITARNLQNFLPTTAYPLSSYPLTTYPLSAFYGWGLKTPVQYNYRFFVYSPVTNQQQVAGLVNWDDPLTTLSEQASSHAAWVNDGGTLEKIFSYYIHKGLGLIN